MSLNGDSSRSFDFVTKEDLIEFAKLHVEAALKEASEKAFAYGEGSSLTTNQRLMWTFAGHIGEVKINKESILNSYPLTNIK